MTYIAGKTHDNAVLLLDAAEQLDLSPAVVLTTSNGFNVPEEVAVKAGLVKVESVKETPKEAPAKRAPAKKTAAKKATTKKAAPATDDKKE